MGCLRLAINSEILCGEGRSLQKEPRGGGAFACSHKLSGLSQREKTYGSVSKGFFSTLPLPLFAHHLKHDVPHPVTGIALHQRQILPRAKGQASLHKRHRNER